MRNLLAVLLCAIAALVLAVGCGGGGGGNPPPSNDPSFRILGFDPNFSATQPVPLSLLMPGDVLQLRLYEELIDGSVVERSATWSTNAPSSAASVSASGVLTISGGAGSTFRIAATLDGVEHVQDFHVAATSQRVGGQIQQGGNPVSQATVRFYDANGVQVATAKSDADGLFAAAVPASTRQFSVDFTDLTSYVNQYGYGDFDYSVLVNGCYTGLPALNATGWTPLSSVVQAYLRSSVPPPPPTGCLFG